MSAYERQLMSRLTALSRTWAREFSGLVVEAQPSLEEIERLGCDRHFVLLVLVNYKWRRLRAVLNAPEKTRLLRSLNEVLGQGAGQNRLRRIAGPVWPTVEAVLRDGQAELMSGGRIEESAFETTWTRFEYEGSHWRSANTYKCLWALDWHLRQTKGAARGRRQRLLDLMADFEYFEQRSRATVAKRLELRRNPMKAPGMRNSQEAVLGFLIRKCHEVHRAAKEPCGPVCEAYPYALPPDWPAQIQEAHLGGVLAAMNGKHDIAVKLIGKALAQAETLLATKDHHLGGLLWQYAIALNAVGRRKEARRLRERSKRMDRRAASRGFPL